VFSPEPQTPAAPASGASGPLLPPAHDPFPRLLHLASIPEAGYDPAVVDALRKARTERFGLRRRHLRQARAR
jgi:hypothetical protein